MKSYPREKISSAEQWSIVEAVAIRELSLLGSPQRSHLSMVTAEILRVDGKTVSGLQAQAAGRHRQK